MDVTSQIPQGGHGEYAPLEFCIRTSPLNLSAKLKEKRQRRKREGKRCRAARIKEKGEEGSKSEKR